MESDVELKLMAGTVKLPSLTKWSLHKVKVNENLLFSSPLPLIFSALQQVPATQQ